MSLFEDTLKAALESAGIGYGDALISRCHTYFNHVIRVNAQLNLPRIIDEAQAAKQHFADAMRLVKFLELPRGCRVVDVGCGAGFPGVPLKLLRDDIDLTLLDASGKKTDFVRDTLQAMGVDARVGCARAEEYARTAARESCGVALSRAVAALPMLIELCVPLLKSGGVLAAWKGETARQELADAESALDTLGCAVKGVHAIGPGALLLIEKQKPTPEKYPRRFAKIKSDPL
jgi:16S rRNA (guanine527-N7)-methyltransferase